VSIEQPDEQWTPEEREEIREQRARFAEIQRRESVESAVKNVWLTYRLLRHRAEKGTPEYQEFDQRRRYYVQVGKRLGSLTREEQDRILEEYPRLVARLEEEHRL
jgi:hypothetical protein